MITEKTLGNLYKSSLRLLQPLSIEQTYKTIVDEAIKLIAGADNGSIFIESGGELSRVYASDPAFYKFKPRKNGYLFTAFKENRSRILTNKQVSRIHPEIDIDKFKSDIIVPLSYRRKQIGLLTLYSKKNIKFAKDDLAQLRLFGPLATMAIVNAKAMTDIQAALNTRDLFISLASHELRTPLTTLGVYTQLLKRNIEKDKMIEMKWIDIINDETKWLNVLFDELLTVDQIKKGKLLYKMGENRLGEIIERAVTHVKAQYPKHKIILRSNLVLEKDTLFCDYDKILQVLVNILVNAAKFSNATDPIEIEIKSLKSSFCIIVNDKGRGIESEDLPNVYEAFYKGKDHMAKGMGLGLFISKQIIKSHKGKISIASIPGQGTEVRIILPR